MAYLVSPFQRPCMFRAGRVDVNEGLQQLEAGPSCLKQNLNAPRPSEHPPVRGKKCQNVEVGSKAVNTKRLHGI